jgi:hypothetical protein
MRPKARGLAQHGDPPGWLEESDPCPNLKTRVFVKTSPKCSYSVIENEHFGLVFAKTGSIILGTDRFDDFVGVGRAIPLPMPFPY